MVVYTQHIDKLISYNIDIFYYKTKVIIFFIIRKTVPLQHITA